MVGRSDVDLDQLDTHTFYCKVMYTTATNSANAEEAAAVAHDPPRPQQLSSGALATKIVEAVSRRMLCFLNRSLRRVLFSPNVWDKVGKPGLLGRWWLGLGLGSFS